MVFRSPRFVVLAALCALAASPPLLPVADAYVLATRRCTDSPAHTTNAAAAAMASSTAAAGRGKSREDSEAVVPTAKLPQSIPPPDKAARIKTGSRKHTSDKHKDKHGGKKSKGKSSKKLGSSKEVTAEASADSGDTWDLLDPLIGIGGLKIGDGRDGSFSDTHGLGDILRREHDHDHDHDHNHRHGHEHDHDHDHRARSLPRLVARHRYYDRRYRHYAREPAALSQDVKEQEEPAFKNVNVRRGDHHHHHDGDEHKHVHVHDRREHDHDHDHRHGHDHDHDHRHGHDHDHDHDKRGDDHDHDHDHDKDRDHDHDHDHDGHHDHDHDHDHDKRSLSYAGQGAQKHFHARSVCSDSYDPFDPILQIGSFAIGDGRKGCYSETHGLLDILKRHVVEEEESRDGVLDLGLDVGLGDIDEIRCRDVHGQLVRCPERQSERVKRATDAITGVPGSVDIMIVGSTPVKRLASLVLSSNGTNDAASKAAGNSTTSHFVLDASNSTGTQFFLVVSKTASLLTNATSAAPNAAPAKDEDDASIPVTLQVPVFQPSTAAMKPFCATFDPNPPAPAPLTMEPCMEESDAMMLGDGATHKSQKFAYDPKTGVVHPMWFTGAKMAAAVNNTLNANSTATTPANATSTTSTTSTSASSTMAMTMSGSVEAAASESPMVKADFKIQQSLKVEAAVPMTSSAPPAPAPGGGDPRSVTLVFTPAGPAEDVIAGPKDVAAFEPVGTQTDANRDDPMTQTSSMSDSPVSATASESSPATSVNSAGDTSTSSSVPMSTDTQSSTTSDAAPTSASASPTSVTASASDADKADAQTSASSSSSTPATSSSSSDASSSLSMGSTTTSDASSTTTSLSPSSTSTGMPTATLQSDAIEKMYQSASN